MTKTKTMVLNDDTHKYLKRVQMTLYEKYDVEMHMPDILSCIIRGAGVKDPDIMAKKIFDKRESSDILIIGQPVTKPQIMSSVS